MEADSQRDRLMANTDRLNRGTDKLRAAAQIALETEEVGASIMQDLESQRATIEHARGTLAGASRGSTARGASCRAWAGARCRTGS